MNILISAIAILTIAVSVSMAADTDRVTVNPADTGEALVNPDMGWTMHYYSNIPQNYG